MPFISNTPAQRQQMLAEIGLRKEDLFADIPAGVGCKEVNLPPGLSEQEVRQMLADMGRQNHLPPVSFLGGGFYDHFTPAAVGAIISRSEFYTAYTPYQPEISQGTLQAIYEWQSAICRLTGMEVANASMYDGGTALFEAVTMAMRVTDRRRMIVSDAVNPICRKMVETYAANLDVEIVLSPSRNGQVDRDDILKHLNEQTAAVIVQNPNFFGCIDDFTDLGAAAKAKGSLLVISSYPTSLGILKTPGEMGADIVVGEGQPLGLPLAFGGPYLGFMTTTKSHARKMPGRIVGRTVDKQGREGFVLTLQAREQHIRRDKATSNICSNEGLCALAALIYMSLLGKQGLADLAKLCADKAAYAQQRLTKVRGCKLKFSGQPIFNEFVLELPSSADQAVSALLAEGIAAGIPLGRFYKGMENCLLIAATEKNAKDDIDFLAQTLEAKL